MFGIPGITGDDKRDAMASLCEQGVGEGVSERVNDYGGQHEGDKDEHGREGVGV